MNRASTQSTPNWFGLVGPNDDGNAPKHRFEVDHQTVQVETCHHNNLTNPVPVIHDRDAANQTASAALKASSVSPVTSLEPPRRQLIDPGAASEGRHQVDSQTIVEEIYSPVRKVKRDAGTAAANPTHRPEEGFGHVGRPTPKHLTAHELVSARHASRAYDIPDRRIGKYAPSYVTNYAANYTANFGESRRKQPPLQIKIADRYAPRIREAPMDRGMPAAPNIDARTA